eukprot:CAMPEP_0180481592 /NCGR_PEP_ID=MMETSP1036_2-20121128/34445_1 /TAXON_ID=632150 /ORGANISM="Azadinium spinosum, Strain 3D9" /LENGTH=50 /DNA_ID=CAMNT_0022489291 /DNA_START=438 /DNA_END=590 /DNA_ORIENTATION=-
MTSFFTPLLPTPRAMMYSVKLSPKVSFWAKLWNINLIAICTMNDFVALQR